MAANVTVGNKAGLTQAKEKFFYKVRQLRVLNAFIIMTTLHASA